VGSDYLLTSNGIDLKYNLLLDVMMKTNKKGQMHTIVLEAVEYFCVLRARTMLT